MTATLPVSQLVEKQQAQEWTMGSCEQRLKPQNVN